LGSLSEPLFWSDSLTTQIITSGSFQIKKKLQLRGNEFIVQQQQRCLPLKKKNLSYTSPAALFTSWHLRMVGNVVAYELFMM